ncbi:AI-2E family transporter [Cellulomonas sp. DKR-3]|uniref:AI-2E family transporter n=1 Tax=Cellulomonas fulva TaxID=2835530 RepID=A0ABS5U120_9CELL|nr:AI-2E family transporter [Cellulomonas fulva]MBT0995093.1 AI-2E family transporter [Cellulomonas fulva]
MTQDQPDVGAGAPAPASSYTLRALVALAATFVLLAGLWWARGFVGPVALAAVVVVIVHPLRFGLERRGWPRGAATTVVVLSGWLVLALIAALIAFAVARFGSMVADYGPELRSALDDARSWLASAGLDGAATDAASRALDPQRLLGVATHLGSSAVAVAGALFLVFAYVLFMAADGARYSTASSLFGGERGPAIARAESYTRGVRRYYVVNATFGAVVAVLDGIALAILGVPAPVVWAILAFVTNFVPNIGFVLGLIPPAILALVVGGWPMMLAVVAIYCVVNVVLQVLVQPKVVSDAVDLSLTLSFASVTFWTFVLGPLGAILSIPLTLLVRTLLLEPDGSAGWLRWLSGDRAAVPVVPAAPTAPTAPAVPTTGERSHQHEGTEAGPSADPV